MNYNSQMAAFLRIATHGNSSVLITGATGTGKSCLARAIHEKSARRLKPFITVNLATLHEGTLESELFGHERGAFTGAEQRRIGRLELANGGTVFLDEIGELSPRLQARLLEFLQSKKIMPVGSNREIALDVRVIAATHRDLSKAVANGDFREDLFHRLRVVSFKLCTLAERRDQFDEILHSCLSEISQANEKKIVRITEGVAEQLERYHWPGNIRELRNVLEYAVQATESDEICLGDLPAWFNEQARMPEFGVERAANDIDMVSDAVFQMGYHRAVEEFNKAYLTRALEVNRWRVTRAAKHIGLSKTSFLRRLNSLGIQPMKGWAPKKGVESLDAPRQCKE